MAPSTPTLTSFTSVVSHIFYDLPPIEIDGGNEQWFKDMLKRSCAQVAKDGTFCPCRNSQYQAGNYLHYKIVGLKGKRRPSYEEKLTFRAIRGMLNVFIRNDCANTIELLAFTEKYPDRVHELGTLFSIGCDEFSLGRFSSMLVSTGSMFQLKQVDLDTHIFPKDAHFLMRGPERENKKREVIITEE
jgi:hypothetical protein